LDRAIAGSNDFAGSEVRDFETRQAEDIDRSGELRGERSGDAVKIGIAKGFRRIRAGSRESAVGFSPVNLMKGSPGKEHPCRCAFVPDRDPAAVISLHLR
jgi:hypothetical protein